MAVSDSACHVGGREFESRRARSGTACKQAVLSYRLRNTALHGGVWMGRLVPGDLGFRSFSVDRAVVATRGDPGSSGQERERLRMPRPDDREVPAVERRDLRLAEPLCRRDDGSVDRAEWEIRVLLNELRHPLQIGSGWRLEPELSASGGAQQRRLSGRAECLRDEVPRFGQNERRRDERSRLTAQ